MNDSGMRPAREPIAAEVFLSSLAEHGVDFFFANPGTDFPPIVEAFSRGRTVVVPRTKVGVQEDGKKLAIVNEGVSLQQLVDALNALGVGVLDMIAILQAMKANGAIQADIEVM